MDYEGGADIEAPINILVNCVAQLLSGSALTWWEAVKIRKTVDVMTSGDFRMEFENKFYIRRPENKGTRVLSTEKKKMSVMEYE